MCRSCRSWMAIAHLHDVGASRQFWARGAGAIELVGDGEAAGSLTGMVVSSGRDRVLNGLPSRALSIIGRTGRNSMRDHQRHRWIRIATYGLHRPCRVIYVSWTRQQGAYRQPSGRRLPSPVRWGAVIRELLEENPARMAGSRPSYAGVLGYSQELGIEVLCGSQH